MVGVLAAYVTMTAATPTIVKANEATTNVMMSLFGPVRLSEPSERSLLIGCTMPVQVKVVTESANQCNSRWPSLWGCRPVPPDRGSTVVRERELFERRLLTVGQSGQVG